jgi:hypothetical protein
LSGVAADLMDWARAGDGDAFQELTEPYRRELLLHCYRMLSSFQDAKHAWQDALRHGGPSGKVVDLDEARAAVAVSAG